MNKEFKEITKYMYDNVKTINDSKIFAGLIILLMNVSSKLITLPVNKTVESIVKHHFSQYVLVFAISWMGTRDIFVAIFVTILFALLMEFLLNEKSSFCCLSEGFISNTPQELKDDFSHIDEKIDNAIKQLSEIKSQITAEISNLKSENNTNTTTATYTS